MRRLVDAKAKVDYSIRIPSGSLLQDAAAKVIAIPGSAFVSTANSKLVAAGVWSVDLAPSPTATTTTSTTTTLGPAATAVSPESDSVPVQGAVCISGLLILGACAAAIYKYHCRAHSDAYNLRHADQTEDATDIEEGQKEELPTEAV